MKLRNLIVAAIACVFALASCEQEKLDKGISVDPTELELSLNGDAKPVEVKTTMDWSVNTGADWLEISDLRGSGSKTITIAADKNTGRDREATVVFRAGVEEATLTVKQPGEQGQYQAAEGDGTKDKPFNVKQAFDSVQGLTWTNTTTYDKVGPYFVKGMVVKVSDPYSSSFGNGTFVISDDGTDDGATLTCYRIMYLEGKKWQEGNTQIMPGDVVVIYGELMYYGTGEEGKTRLAETVQSGSYLVSLNGETVATGGIVVDYDAAEAVSVADFISKADNTTYYKLTGTVSRFSSQYCSFDLTDASGTIYVYSVENKAEWVDKISNGATVVLAGKYEYYAAKQQHEVVNAHIISCEGGTPAVDPNAAEPKSVAEFIRLADNDTYYKLTGTVSSFNANYCSFDLTDDSGTIYVYSVKNKSDWSSKITNGATVVLAGQYLFYEQKNQHEVVNAYIISCEGGTTPVDDTPQGDGTLATPYNPKAAADLASSLDKGAKTENDVYVVGKISSIKYTFSADYGTATFFISDDGTTSGTQFQVYSVYYLGNRAWVDGDTQIAVGDHVIICGKLTNYNGTPETASKEAYIFSLNGETYGGTPPEPPVQEDAKGNGTLDSPYNPKAAADVASALEKGAKTENDVYVAGKISSIKYTFSADYGTATFFISEDGSASGTQFQVYSVYYLGNRAWVEGDTQVAVGDEVIICGKLTNYNGTPETSSKEAYIYSLNGDTGEGQGGDPKITNFKASFYQFGLSLSWNAVNGAQYYEWLLTDAAGTTVAKGATDQTSVNSDFGTVNASAYTNLGEAWYAESGYLNGNHLKYGTYYVTLSASVPGTTSEISASLTVENKMGELNVTKLVGTDTGFEAEWSAYEGKEFFCYYWELHVVDDAGSTSRAITGCTTDPYVRDLPAQTKYVDESHNTSWLVDGMVQGAKYYFIVVAVTDGNWPLAQSSGKNHFTFGATYNPVSIDLNFATKPSSDFPEGSANGITQGTYNLGGYSFTFYAKDKFYWNTEGYVLIGKAQSYILLPKIEGLALKKVGFKTGSKASENVIVDVVESDGTEEGTGRLNVNTGKLLKGTEYSWDVPGSADKYYFLYVMNAYNAQFQTLTLYYE